MGADRGVTDNDSATTAGGGELIGLGGSAELF